MSLTAGTAVLLFGLFLLMQSTFGTSNPSCKSFPTLADKTPASLCDSRLTTTSVPSTKPVTKPTAKPTIPDTKATIRSTAKPITKPVAKPTTKKPTAKPTIIKPTTKSTIKVTIRSTAKPITKPVANTTPKKPATELTITKPTKKSTIKVTIRSTAKPITKPVANPTPKKPTTELTITKPTKKSTVKTTTRKSTIKVTIKPTTKPTPKTTKRPTTKPLKVIKGRKTVLTDGITILCEENNMEIDINATKYSFLDPSKFHLKDKKCVSVVSGNVIQLRSPLNGCGTSVVETTDGTTYKNVVRAFDIKSPSPGVSVTREDDLTLPFNCTYGRRKMVSMTSFKALRRVDATEGSLGNFTFTMDLFSSKDFKTSYTQSDYPLSVQLNDPVHVQFSVASEKGDLHVFAEKCLATTTTSETSTPSYVFLKNGCPTDPTMVYNYSPNRVQNFTINAFRFISDNPIVYLHCLLMVCHSTSKSTKCSRGCVKNKVKRDISRGKTIIDESRLYHLASGPLTRKKTQGSYPNEPPDSENLVLIVSTVTTFGFVLLITSIVLTVCLLLKRKAGVVNLKELEPLQLREYDSDAVQFHFQFEAPNVCEVVI